MNENNEHILQIVRHKVYVTYKEKKYQAYINDLGCVP